MDAEWTLNGPRTDPERIPNETRKATKKRKKTSFEKIGIGIEVGMT